MFNLVRDDFDENSEDILNSINKMLEQNKELKEEEKKNENNNKNLWRIRKWENYL